jgi:hypothetical protein
LASPRLPGDLEAYIGARLRQDDTLGAQGFELLQRAELARALDPIVLAELLIHAKVPDRLAEHGVGDSGQQGLLFGGEVHCIYGVEGVGREKLVGKGQGAVDAADDAGAVGTQHLGVFCEQIAHGHHGGPAGLGVVADVEHAAHLELAAHEIDDDRAVLVRDPAPDAVQADVVKLGQLGAAAERIKRLVKQLRAGVGHVAGGPVAHEGSLMVWSFCLKVSQIDALRSNQIHIIQRTPKFTLVAHDRIGGHVDGEDRGQLADAGHDVPAD